MKLKFRELRMDARVLRKEMKIGVPGALQACAYGVTNVVIQASVNSFGTDTAAGWAAYGKLDMIFWTVSSALGAAVTTFAGQNYGAGKMDRVYKSIRVNVVISYIFTGVIIVILFVFCEPLYHMFTTDPKVIGIGVYMLRFLIPSYLLSVLLENLSGSSVLTNQTKQALYNLLDKLDTAQYTGISDAQDSFLLAQNRLQISTGQTADFSQSIAALQTEYDGIKAQLDTLQTVTATTNGYFSRTEASPAIRTDCRALADADPATLQKMLADGFPAADTNRAGQIATGFSWKFYAVCDLDTAARFDGLSTVKISVPGKQNTPLSATVEEITEDKDNGIAKIVLQCQTISAEVLGLGCETVQVDLKTYEGIRIDKAALHIVNGQRGVYVKYGNLQRFLKITTLYENDSYILVPEDGKLGSANEVRLYDEIIVQGTNLEDGKLL